MEKFCQNCGLPVNDLPPGSPIAKIHKKYCGCGFGKRPIIQPGKASKKFNIKKMKEEGMPKFLAWLASRGISKLL